MLRPEIPFDKIASLSDLLALLRVSQIPEQMYSLYAERYLSWKSWEKGIPYRGTFELTPLCNLDCRMCYVHLKKEQLHGAPLLAVSEWQSLMQQAVESGMGKAILTGGECLTYPGFKELYLFLQSHGVAVSVYTNGTLLDDLWIRFFLQHPPEVIQISIYGSDELGYEHVTGHRVQQLVMQHLQTASDAGLPVRAAVTPSSFMGEDAKKIIRSLSEQKIPFQINNTLFEPRSNTGRRGKVKDLLPEQYIELFKLEAELSGVQLISKPEETLPPLPVSDHKIVHGLRCAAGRNSFEITWQGKMQGCSSLDMLSAEPLKTGFAQAWKNLHTQALNYPVPAQCGQCVYRESCVSCPAQHQQLGASIGQCSPSVCNRTKCYASEGLIPFPNC